MSESYVKCHKELDNDYDRAKCSASILQTTKACAIMSAKAIDAAGTCKAVNPANLACGAGITKALGAFAFISNQISEMVYHCPQEKFDTNPNAIYDCGRNIDRIGYITKKLSPAIAIAVANCGLGADVESVTEPLSLPHRFFD